MTLVCLATPWYRRLAPARSAENTTGSSAATRILDHDSPAIQGLLDRARLASASSVPLDVLAHAHGMIVREVRPVYALNESVPASVTLIRGRGSCSQRLAILESVARGLGIRTRVRALGVDRAFWYPRFPRIRRLLPPEILLLWPEFDLGGWKGAAELFGPLGCHGGAPFTNVGAETLFEAAGRCAVDWDGVGRDSAQDLSGFVRADYGRFADRDQAIRELGQTLCLPSRMCADPLMRRIAA